MQFENGARGLRELDFRMLHMLHACSIEKSTLHVLRDSSGTDRTLHMLREFCEFLLGLAILRTDRTNDT